MSKLSSAENEPRLRELAALCRLAFASYGAQALWSLREMEEPTPGYALLVARQLRLNGDLSARSLAERIEELADADL